MYLEGEITMTDQHSSQSLGRRFLVRVTGTGCGRSRFVEERLFLTPWRCQARKFKYAEQAEAFMSELAPAPGQSIEVRHWDDAWHEDISGPEFAHRWMGCPKIAKK
jgi:hypothetical protein